MSDIDDAIEIIVKAMNDVEDDRKSNPKWYLAWFKLERIFNRLIREKYFPAPGSSPEGE
jgi:DNA-binding XRE family transcriptional regulator